MVPEAASAQSSPTTTLTEAGKFDLSFDLLGSIARRRAGGFEWYLPAVTFGVSDRLEVGGAVSALVPSTADEPREFVPHVRWRWLETASHLEAAIGGDWHFPLSNRATADGYGLVDVTFSQTIGHERSATITAGLYTLVGRERSDDTRHGVTLGWDQTISSHWSYSIEWTSGNNWYGYLSSAVTFTASQHWVTVGYCIGNQPAANHGPCVSAGRTF